MSKEKGCKFVPNDASFSLLVLNFFLGCDLVYALVGCDQKAVKPSEMKLYTCHRRAGPCLLHQHVRTHPALVWCKQQENVPGRSIDSLLAVCSFGGLKHPWDSVVRRCKVLALTCWCIVVRFGFVSRGTFFLY
jgi:hypothetical protein